MDARDQAGSPGRTGRLFVVSAPSGAGKTTLVRRLVERRPGLRFSISYTTRRARPGERPGIDYFFVDPDAFQRMAVAGEFLEHAEVFGNRYGTGRRQVVELLAAGHDVLLEIDWQGARQVRANLPECISVFIAPPSLAELERRLRGRGTDSEAVIARRLGEAREDLSHWPEFDHAVVNDDLDQALDALDAIIAGAGEATATDRPALRDRLAALLRDGG